MNWCDEKYVKLYTRDSLTWRSWPWQAKALWPLILRKLDGAGLMETGNLDPADAVALQTDIPVDVVRVGLAAIIASGTLTQVVGGLLGSSFVEAQEARKTEAQKKRDQRERVRDQRVQAQVTEIREVPVPTMSPGVPRCPPQSPSSPAQPSPAQPEKLPRAFALAADESPKSRRTHKTDADPRHAPLVAALVDGFRLARGSPYPFGPRDAGAVRDLLGLAEPPAIVEAWGRALRHVGYPSVATLPELKTNLARFLGVAPATAANLKNPAPVADWANAVVGEIEL